VPPRCLSAAVVERRTWLAVGVTGRRRRSPAWVDLDRAAFWEANGPGPDVVSVEPSAGRHEDLVGLEARTIVDLVDFSSSRRRIKAYTPRFFYEIAKRLRDRAATADFWRRTHSNQPPRTRGSRLGTYCQDGRHSASVARPSILGRGRDGAA
jgi:hypothetical protein